MQNESDSVPALSVKPHVIGCSWNILRLVSSVWPLSDWLEWTVGGVHLFVICMHVYIRNVLKSTNTLGNLQMHKKRLTNVCSDLQADYK